MQSGLPESKRAGATSESAEVLEILRELNAMKTTLATLRTSQEDSAARADVADLILRERMARDTMNWEEMKSYYHPESIVNVSWFYGTGAEFVEKSKTAVRPNLINFHMMTPPVVTRHGDRAISDTPCVLRSFSTMDSVEASYEGFVRIFWRARRDAGRWLIAGLHCIYVVDMFHARNPSKPPHFDDVKLATYRNSYRYLMANLANHGISVRDDLVGADRPASVAAAKDAEHSWLMGG
jgi:SnoaL-like domain